MGSTGRHRGFEARDNQLVIGGTTIDRLAARTGGTPFFAYDRARIVDRIGYFRSAMPEQVRVSYAVKANPYPALVQHVAGMVDGLDVASGGELMTAMDTTMAAEHISFAGPGKTACEIRQAVASGVLISVESATQLRETARAGDSLGIRPRVMLRLNPDFGMRGSGMRMGGGAQPFGIDVDQGPDVLADISALDLEFNGIQVFAGSQCLSAETIIDAQRKAVELAIRLTAESGVELRHLNIGGGFGIPYFPKEAALDLAPIGTALASTMEDLLAGEAPQATLVIELGRYLVGEAGVYVTRVLDRKVSRGKTFLITDGGLHHHLAASGNFGQVIRRNYPVALGNRVRSDSTETVSVVGCLCTPLDILAADAELPTAEVGDLFVVFQSGAYGRSASPLDFLGHPQPPEVLV